MPGYQTKQESIAIAGVANLVIRSLRDRQQFSDPGRRAERLGISSAAWPIFGLPWPSGRQLAARLATRTLRPGERILEIGCGLALASLVGHRRGASVTASDMHPLAAAFLAHNLRLNALPPMHYRHGEWGSEALAPAEGARPNSAVRGRYDLLIASDVLYERESGVVLAGFIGRHAAPAAEVWIVDPDRGNRPPFNRGMARLGFVLTEERLDARASGGEAAYKGRLLSYRRG
ncbi:MAG: SAM-dependent methyltransferase [Rubrivivax sp.]|nr:SAM-dependent methyltransferase [Rubrivivax sp.]